MLSERWQRFHAHAQAWMTTGRHALVLGLVVFAGWCAWSAVRAVQSSAVQQEQQRAAATVAHEVPDKKVKGAVLGMFGGQKSLNRKQFPRDPSAPFHPAPPDATPSVPHPDVTTATAKHGPEVTVFEPANAKDKAELVRDFNIDFDHWYVVTQRKELGPMRYGADIIGRAPAGGGDVVLDYKEHPRPKIGFPKVFELGAGGGVAGTEHQAAGGFTLHTGLEPLRTGNVFWRLNGDVDVFSQPLNGERLHWRVMGLGIWRVHGGDPD